MIDEQDIKNEVRPQTYQRGQLIFQCQGVKDLRIDVGEDADGYLITEVGGNVRGSCRDYYEVNLSIDEEYSEIIDCCCKCPAFESVMQMCKHCVALGLQYIQIRDSGRSKLFLGTSKKVKKMQGIRITEPEFDRILKSYARKQMVSYYQLEMNGKVRLEPMMRKSMEEVRLEFRIGIQKMYILKNITQLVHAVENMEEVSYGKQFGFVHHREAFTPKSQKILEFVIQQSRRLKGGYGGYERAMVLSQEGFETFRKMMGEREFSGIVYGDQAETWHFEEREPRPRLVITGDDQGIRMEMEHVSKFAGEQRIYYFRDGAICCVQREREEEIHEFEEYMNSWRSAQNYVAIRELPLFVRNLLPILKEHYAVEICGFDPSVYAPPEASFKLYLDAPEKNRITCDLVSVYGGEQYHVFEGVEESEKRNAAKEIEVGNLICCYCNAYDDKEKRQIIMDDEKKMYELLTEGIPKFQEIAEVFISERLKTMRIIHTPKVSVGVSLSGGLLELSLDAGELPLDQLATVLSKYDRKKKFYRLKSGEFLNLEGSGLSVLSDMRENLHLTEKNLLDGKVTLPKYRALYLEGQLREQEGVLVTKNKDFHALIRKMKAVEDNNFEVPETLEPILREYQKKGFRWLKTLKENGFGGILADDMGLGKTLQVIAYFLSEYENRGKEPIRGLIVCPASLVYNWMSEFQQYAPGLQVKLIVGNAIERRELIRSAEKDEILITSYDLLKRDIDDYRGIFFASQIIDEAQFIKNHATQTAKAVKMIDAGFKAALTGTPVENRLSELWSIFEYLMPGYLYSYQRFRREIESPVVQEQDEEALHRLRLMIRPFILRRLKKDVLKDLPEKLEKNMYARMEGEQRQLYQAHVQRLKIMLAGQTREEFDKSKIQILAELTKLRQLCCDPALLLEGYEVGSAKLDLCIDMVENAVEGGHKILVFSQFTTMLDHICRKLEKRGISYYLLTGAASKEERMKMVQAFNRDETSVFCISLKAGGTGLNLTAADMVIHFDPWWNTAVQNQATDRAHRIGQENTVMVYRLIAKGSIEEKIVELQEKKQQLAEQVLGGEEMQKGTFTKEELLELLE